MPLQFHTDQPGTTYDSAWWDALYPLFDEAFPGLPRGITRAADVGVSWADVTTPFVALDGGRPVAHVGLLEHAVRMNGEDRVIAGIHAVCTTASHRRQGLARELLRRALAHAEAHGMTLAKLHTDDPPVYTSNGFRSQSTFRWRAAVPPAGGVQKRPLRPASDPADAALLTDLLARRTPASDRFSTRDPGWLVTIDAALQDRLDTAFTYLPDHDAIVAFVDEDDATLVTEVIAAELPPAASVLGAAPDPSRPTWWTMPPDRLDPQATPAPAPADIGTFMVRGPWPIETRVGISPLWEH